jgi:ADP-L-glycero-D-manno-heptose 6-epimerase
MTLFFYDNPHICGLFNIGTGKARSRNDLVKAVFAAMDKKPNIEYIEMPESIRGQYQYYTEADITSLRRAGYEKNTISLEDAIKDYVQNYLQKTYTLMEPSNEKIFEILSPRSSCFCPHRTNNFYTNLRF